jgi:hypothetical protein
MSTKKTKKKAAHKGKKKAPSTYGSSKQSAYGDEKAICRNAKCKLRKASCVGFVACPGFKG